VRKVEAVQEAVRLMTRELEDAGVALPGTFAMR